MRYFLRKMHFYAFLWTMNKTQFRIFCLIFQAKLLVWNLYNATFHLEKSCCFCCNQFFRQFKTRIMLNNYKPSVNAEISNNWLWNTHTHIYIYISFHNFDHKETKVIDSVMSHDKSLLNHFWNTVNLSH